MGRSASLRTLSTMCGRYAATANPDELIEEFEVELDRTGEPARSILKNPQSPPPGTPDCNLAPEQAGAGRADPRAARDRRGVCRDAGSGAPAAAAHVGAGARAGPRTSRSACG